MAEALFDCEEVDLDYLFSTTVVEKHCRIKWVMKNLSKLPEEVLIPGPEFQLVSNVKYRLEMLKDSEDFNLFLSKTDQSPKESDLPSPGVRYEITRYSTAIFDISGFLQKVNNIFGPTVECNPSELLKTKPLAKLEEDTLVVICDLTVSELRNYALEL